MAFFVSCNSLECPKRFKCGRYSHYTDEAQIADFWNKTCKDDIFDVMFLTQMDVRENNMAKKKTIILNDVHN